MNAQLMIYENMRNENNIYVRHDESRVAPKPGPQTTRKAGRSPIWVKFAHRAFIMHKLLCQH